MQGDVLSRLKGRGLPMLHDKGAIILQVAIAAAASGQI